MGKKLFTLRCPKSPSALNLASFPSPGSEMQAEIKPGFLDQTLSPCPIVPTSAEVLPVAIVLLLWVSWYHLPIWITPRFYGVTSHVTHIAGREVPCHTVTLIQCLGSTAANLHTRMYIAAVVMTKGTDLSRYIHCIASTPGIRSSKHKMRIANSL